jgi:hypothetical protein
LNPEKEYEPMHTQYLKYASELTFLVLTWLLLFVIISFFNSLFLVPWDTAITMPEVGTLARTANDFFDRYPWIVTVPLILASLWLAVPAVRRQPDISTKFAGTNLMCLALILLTFMPAALINNIVFPYPPVEYDPTYDGYHRSVLPTVVMLTVCAGWLLWQRRIRIAVI